MMYTNIKCSIYMVIIQYLSFYVYSHLGNYVVIEKPILIHLKLIANNNLFINNKEFINFLHSF